MPIWVDGLAAEAGAEIIRAADTLAGGAAVVVVAWGVSWEASFSEAGILVAGIPAAVADIPADEEVIRAGVAVVIRAAREPVETNTNVVIGILTTWPVSAARGFTTLIRRISVIRSSRWQRNCAANTA